MKRIPSLDGIRAISVAFVILCHFGNDIGFGDPLNLGSLGVRTFFVISGFLITGLLLAEMDKTKSINLRNFYFRRTLRIFPPFYCYLSVMMIISAFGWSCLTLEGALPALTYTSNYWSNWNSAGYVTSNAWSLATEEQFYLIWPLTLNLLGQRYGRLALIGVIVCSPLLRSVIYLRAGHLTSSLNYSHLNADHLATGCLLAFLSAWLRGSPMWRHLPSYLFVILPVCILVANSCTNHPSIHRTILPTFINVAIAACVFWAVTNEQSVVGKWLNVRAVAWIGALSYSLYLWQQPFLHLHVKQPTLLLNETWRIIAYPPVSLTLVMACACVSYYCVERPSLKVREWLEEHRRDNTSIATMVAGDEAAAG